jgi:hypothetical protein
VFRAVGIVIIAAAALLAVWLPYGALTMGKTKQPAAEQPAFDTSSVDPGLESPLRAKGAYRTSWTCSTSSTRPLQC